MASVKKTPAGNGEADLSLGVLGEFVGFRLRRIQNYLSRDFAAATSEHNLRHGLFTALAVVAANPGLSQIALAREVGLDKSLAVGMVDEMERRGWAERRRSTVDRRRHDLFVTPEGEVFLDEMFAKLSVVEKEALAALSPKEHEVLSELLDRIYKACFRD